VSYQDALLVQLLDQLAQWGELDQTMVIVTSDGGMGLWEDGRCGPETWLRAPALRVPLLVHYPPLFPAGRVAPRGAEAIDLLPTLLRALGLPVPVQAQGIPLLGPAQEAASGYPRPLLASHDVRAHAMRLAGWTIHVGTAGVPAIYDVKADPREQRNLAAARPIERRFLTDVLSLLLPYRHEWNQRAWGTAANMSAEGLRRIEGGTP
jgi:arylsulfatase A-like enzyme